jgi:hypothetical protein
MRDILALFEGITFENWPQEFSKRSYFDALVFVEFQNGKSAEEKSNSPLVTYECSLAEMVVVAALVDLESGFGALGLDIASLISYFLRAMVSTSNRMINITDIYLMRLKLRFGRNFI